MMLAQHEAASITQMFLRGSMFWRKEGTTLLGLETKMAHFTRRRFTAVGPATLLSPVGALRAAGDRMSVDGRGVALDGYDTTAYWQHGAVRLGLDAHVVDWRGAKWHFATLEHADMFAADPEKFAPQFGGFCTRAMSFKKIVNGDPQVWRIYEDHLYLFAQPVGGEKFDEGQDAMIAKAQAYWDTLS